MCVRVWRGFYLVIRAEANGRGLAEWGGAGLQGFYSIRRRMVSRFSFFAFVSLVLI